MEELRIENWDMFLQVANRLDVGDSFSLPYAFRGHADKEWKLQSSFHRAINTECISEKDALGLENATLNEFKSQAHFHLQPNEYSLTTDTISWLTMMQHHGAPTRLLDWTSSIFVAVYFAVNAEFEKDGSVTLVHTGSVVSGINSLFGDTTVPTTEALIKKDYLSEGAPHTFVFAARLSKSKRMAAQQGFFSVSRNVLGQHEEILRGLFNKPNSQEMFRKLIIPMELKRVFLKKLRQMNVTANSLYPGLDGLGKSVTELLNASRN